MLKTLIKLLCAFFICALFVNWSHAQERDDYGAMARAIVKISANKVPIDTAEQIVATAHLYAKQNELDPIIVLSIINQESTFNRNAKSPDGSVGLMQVHYPVHKKSFNGVSPFEVDSSIKLGTMIYKQCLNRSKGSLYASLNCYSGGGGAKHYEHFMKAKRQFTQAYLEQLFG